MKGRNVLLIITASLLFVSCGVKTVRKENVSLKSIDTIEKTKLEELSAKKIFFGHKSVGQNILEGLEEISTVPISLIKNSGDTIDEGINHAYIGENSNPISKIEDFKKRMDKRWGDKADIAFFKFCYVDIDNNTDIKSLFENYRNTMNYLKNTYPNTTFIHVTTPLVAKPKGGIKSTVKKILRMPIWGIHDNIKREEYNQIMRTVYAGKEPVFDLAFFESIALNGTRTTYESNGERFYTLASSMTYDGGHLNEAGKKHIAEQLLIFLTSL